MGSITITSVAFACIFGGALFGLFLRSLLPDHHLTNDAREVVKLGAGLIATMAALVLGLLISSAKSSLDTMSNELTQTSTMIIELDQTLASYGAETAELRQVLHKGVAAALDRINPGKVGKPAVGDNVTVTASLEKIQRRLRALSPPDTPHSLLQSQALQIARQMAHSRLLLVEQSHSPIPITFLIILIFWLNVLFVSFGLLAPRNKTVFGVLFVCALSVSAAIFLIMEMNTPFQGIINVSVTPLQNALQQLGK